MSYNRPCDSRQGRSTPTHQHQLLIFWIPWQWVKSLVSASVSKCHVQPPKLRTNIITDAHAYNQTEQKINLLKYYPHQTVEFESQRLWKNVSLLQTNCSCCFPTITCTDNDLFIVSFPYLALPRYVKGLNSWRGRDLCCKQTWLTHLQKSCHL